MNLSRRGFLKLSSLLCSSLFWNSAEAAKGKYATLIDLSKCDGCTDEPIPRCVKACRDYNKERFPEPKNQFYFIGRETHMRIGLIKETK